MNGSGRFEYSINYEDKQICIDYSGRDENDNCFRNDSSIMFFLANSYAYSANVLLDKINEGFETKSDYRIISKLVIPYMFHTRHYIELELKGLIARLKDNKGHASNEHDLRKLIEELETCLKSYTYDQVGDEYYKRSLYEKNMTIVMERFDSAKKTIYKYIDEEPFVEFYRFIFQRDYRLKKEYVSFDYNNQKSLFNSVYNDFKVIIKLLHCSGITILDK